MYNSFACLISLVVFPPSPVISSPVIPGTPCSQPLLPSRVDAFLFGCNASQTTSLPVITKLLIPGAGLFLSYSQILTNMLFHSLLALFFPNLYDMLARPVYPLLLYRAGAYFRLLIIIIQIYPDLIILDRNCFYLVALNHTPLYEVVLNCCYCISLL